jgi:hypothetical protein
MEYDSILSKESLKPTQNDTGLSSPVIPVVPVHTFAAQAAIDLRLNFKVTSRNELYRSHMLSPVGEMMKEVKDPF